jgi:phage-related protein
MSGGTSQTGEVAITISAIDEASDVIENVQSNLSDLTTSADTVGPAMGNVASSTGDATESMDGLNQSTMWSMQGFMGLSSTLRMGISDYERMEMMHIRIEASTEAVQKAQEAYNAAVQKYGENSTQAHLALETLQTDEDRLNYYQQRNILNYVQMGLQIPMIIASLTQMAGSLGGLGAALGSAGDAIGGVVAALGPVGIAIIAIVAVIAILYEAWTNDWGGIREKTAAAVKDIEDALGAFVTWLQGLGADVSKALTAIGDWLKANWEAILVIGLTGPLGLVYEAWVNDWGGFRTIVLAVVQDIGNILTGFKDTVTKAITSIGDWLKSNWQDILTVALTGPVGLVLLAWEKDWGGLRDIVTKALTDVGTAIKNAVDALVTPFKTAADTVMQILGTDLPKTITSFVEWLEKTFQGLSFLKDFGKMFSDAFQMAEDLVKPILTDISNAITDFLNAIEKAFTDFYNWLVGASMIQDTWTAVLDITDKGVTQLLDLLTSKLFDPIEKLFTDAMQLVEDIWNKAWTMIQTILDTITPLILADLNAWFDLVKTAFTDATDLLESIWQTAWDTIQSVFATVTAAIQTAWQTFLNIMQTATSDFWSAVESITSGGFEALETGFTDAMNTIESIVNGAIAALEAAWGAFMGWIQAQIGMAENLVGGAVNTINGMLAGANNAGKEAGDLAQGIAKAVADPLGTMVSLASSAGQAISGGLNSAFNAISSGATGLFNALVGHSLWTDMLTEMQAQTFDALGNIVSAFTGGFGTIAGGVPSGGSVAGGLLSPSLTAALQGLAGNQQTTITIPITVTLDGQTISRQVEQRTVNRIASTMKVVSTVTKAA